MTPVEIESVVAIVDTATNQNIDTAETQTQIAETILSTIQLIVKLIQQMISLAAEISDGVANKMFSSCNGVSRMNQENKNQASARLLQTTSSTNSTYVCTDNTLSFEEFERMMLNGKIEGSTSVAKSFDSNSGSLESIWASFIGSNDFRS
jgi:hypothetical protein